jgi:hypothetical protein
MAGTGFVEYGNETIMELELRKRPEFNRTGTELQP